MLSHQFVSYFSIIKRLVSQIRTLQLENGFSTLQINAYLDRILSQYIQAHSQANSMDQFISISIQKSTIQAQKIIGGLIQLLQVQKSNLQENNYSQLRETIVEKKQDVDSSQNKKNVYIQIPVKDNPEQLSSLVKTPEYKLNRARLLFGQPEQIIQSSKQFDKIEKSIEETLERTRKLRGYLNEKLMEQKLRKLKLKESDISNQEYDYEHSSLEWM